MGDPRVDPRLTADPRIVQVGPVKDPRLLEEGRAHCAVAASGPADPVRRRPGLRHVARVHLRRSPVEFPRKLNFVHLEQVGDPTGEAKRNEIQETEKEIQVRNLRLVDFQKDNGNESISRSGSLAFWSQGKTKMIKIRDRVKKDKIGPRVLIMVK